MRFLAPLGFYESSDKSFDPYMVNFLSILITCFKSSCQFLCILQSHAQFAKNRLSILLPLQMGMGVNGFRLELNEFSQKFLVELHRDSGLFLQNFGYFQDSLFNETPLKISRRTHSILACAQQMLSWLVSSGCVQQVPNN